MVVRDFRGETKQRLLALADDVAPKDAWYSKAADWIGDSGLGVKAWWSGLDIGQSQEDMDHYHRQIIDKNDASRRQINDIWAKVNGVADRYTPRFAAVAAGLDDLAAALGKLADAIDPDGGGLGADGLDAADAAIGTYGQNKTLINQLNTTGISQSDLSTMSNADQKAFLDHLVTVVSPLLPDITENSEFSMPVGPGLTFTYKTSVEAKSEKDGPVSTSVVLTNQKAQIQAIATGDDGSFTIDSDGNPSASTSATYGEWTGGTTFTDNTASATWKRTHDNNTQSYGFKLDLKSRTAEVNYGVSSNTSGMTISSEAALTAELGNVPQWETVRVSEPVAEPYPATVVPALEEAGEWVTDHGTEILVGTGVVVGVVAIGIFVPELLPALAFAAV